MSFTPFEFAIRYREDGTEEIWFDPELVTPFAIKNILMDAELEGYEPKVLSDSERATIKGQIESAIESAINWKLLFWDNPAGKWHYEF